MRPLKRLGYYEDLFDFTVNNLTRRAVLCGEFVRRPRRSAFVRIRILVVVALERERLVAPRELKNLKNFLENLAVGPIDIGLIGSRGGNVQLLPHLIEPSGLIAARKTDEAAAARELVEPSDFDCQPQRVPSR